MATEANIKTVKSEIEEQELLDQDAKHLESIFPIQVTYNMTYYTLLTKTLI